jgi:hypothetical protein
MNPMSGGPNGNPREPEPLTMATPAPVGTEAASAGSKDDRNNHREGRVSIFLHRKNLQESGGQMPLFPYIGF